MSRKSSGIGNYVKWQITRLVESKNESLVRASLANLRRALGKEPGAKPEVWAFTLENLPEEHLSRTGVPTRGEHAIHTAMTMFALHQQGKDIETKCMHTETRTFAGAIALLVDNEDDLKRVKRRFDAAVTAQSIDELVHHARGLVQQLKSDDVAFNYPRFAEDIYWYQNSSSRDGVRLRWGQEFYQSYSMKMSADKKKEEKKS